jgi:beta-N-acetylhexosaminidase
MKLQIGEFFILGFRARNVPNWLMEFASEFGLGGVVLFDYDCIDRTYQRNVFDSAQVKELCAQIHALPTRPLIFIDQEGGRVRRLKEEFGFVPLPSARQFGKLTPERRSDVLRAPFVEMRDIGIDVNLSPVVVLDSDPSGADMDSTERSYSRDPRVVEECAHALLEVARSVGLKLCLKHFPGVDSAKVGQNDQIADLSASINDTQLGVFRNLLESIPMIQFSHGTVRQWENDTPVSLSRTAVDIVRSWAPDAHIIADDLQMRGLQKLMSTCEACRRAIRAGVDMVTIGNNLKDEQVDMGRFARELLNFCEAHPAVAAHAEASICRTRKLKST